MARKLPGVLVPCGYCNKSLQSQRFKTTRMSSLIVLEDKFELICWAKVKVSRVLASSGGSSEETISLHLVDTRGFLPSLPCALFLKLFQPLPFSITSPTSYFLCLLFRKTLMITFMVHENHLG